MERIIYHLPKSYMERKVYDQIALIRKMALRAKAKKK